MSEPTTLEPEVDPSALFLSHLPTVERAITFVVSRHYLSAAEAQDFGAQVKLKLIDNDYRLIRRVSQAENMAAYLMVTVARLFLDHRRSICGKWRSSAAAKRAGPIGVLLERLIDRDGHPFEEAIEVLRSRHHIALARTELERIAGQLPTRSPRALGVLGAQVDAPSHDALIVDALHDREQQQRADRLSDVLGSAVIDLPAEDRLLLMLRFVDGHTVADIAALLRLEARPLYRRFDRLLGRLRQTLEDQGIDVSQFREMLTARDVSFGERLRDVKVE